MASSIEDAAMRQLGRRSVGQTQGREQGY